MCDQAKLKSLALEQMKLDQTLYEESLTEALRYLRIKRDDFSASLGTYLQNPYFE